MEAEQINKLFGDYYEGLSEWGKMTEAAGLAPMFGSLRFNFANGRFVNANVDLSTPPQKKESQRSEIR